MTKQELRKTYLQKRLTLKETEYTQLNRLLCENFFRTIDLSSVKVLHSFLPIVKNREPDTWLIIRRIQDRFAHIKVSVPKINPDDNMVSYDLDEEKLEVTSWGIPEPKDGVITNPSAIDLVLVPLLAFDKTGHRVGYGKGYYDRFLKDCRPDTKKIGLSFFPPEDKIAGVFSDDFAIHGVITPDRFYTFSD